MSKNIYKKEFLPIAYYSYVNGELVSDSLIPIHCHEELEIIELIEGHFTIEIPGTSINLSIGDVMIINSSAPHGTITYDDTKTAMLRFNPLKFTDKFSDNTADFALLYEARDYMYFTKKQAKKCGITAQLEILEKYKEKADEYSIGAIYSLIGLLKEVGFFKEKSNVSDMGLSSTLPIVEYIKEHFSEELMVKDLAHIFNYDKDYLSRLFKKSIGKSITEYINELRVLKAKPLLATTDLSITDIAMQLGFSSCTYFIRIFKKYNNLTPNIYRERIKNKLPIGYHITPEDYKWYAGEDEKQLPS